MSLQRRLMKTGHFDDPLRDIVSLWLLRLLSYVGAGTIFAPGNFYDMQSLLSWLGLLLPEEQDKLPDFKQLRTKLAKRQRILEKKGSQIVGPLRKNLELLSRALHLNKVEMECLGFCVLVKLHDQLGAQIDRFSITDSTRLESIVGSALGCAEHETRGIFSPQGSLLSAGLIALDFEDNCASRMVCPIEGLVNALGQPNESVEDILGCFVDKAPEAKLSQADYPHLARDSEILRAYLIGVRKSRLTGVNILIYGPSGTGKTEYVRMLAAEQDFNLFEVPSEYPQGGTLPPDQRLSACQFAQNLLTGRPETMLLFDEIEDVLDPWAQITSRSHVSKQRVNRILEDNAVPTFWVCNNHEVVAPWQLRRFDYVLRMSGPPKSVRLKIAEEALAKLDVSPPEISVIAKEASVSPALIAKASRVATGAQLGGYLDSGSAVLRYLSNSLKAGDQRHQLCRPQQAMLPLSLDFYNTDCDLKALMDGLTRTARGRVCLHGPPGTGKTSFARIIAEVVDKPLVSRKASDLLGCFVGQTEKAIRLMFDEAKDEDAVLLIDEMESLISDRSHAHRTWEISQVNEMLVGLESFDGLVIGATNFFERLDRAALRRFDFKIELGYLKTDQVLKMFDTFYKKSESIKATIPNEVLRQLRKLTCVTPGDFAVVTRRMHILGESYSPEKMAAVLAAECEGRETHQTRIGFLASV